MTKKTKTPKYVKISTPAVVFFSLLLSLVSFYAGISYYQQHHGDNTSSDKKSVASFQPTKSKKPELKFFVMSFCPYGNQIEDVIRPVAELLKDKTDIRPQYIFNKIKDLNTYCKNSSGDASKCQSYVENGYFKTVANCKKTLTDNLKKCLNTNDYIKSQDGNFYSSLHGRSEANQDIREICAWQQTDDKSKWWKFVLNVNKNCNPQNVDSCWQKQANQAGLDENKITDCFDHQAIALIEKEIEQTDKYKVTGSPTLIINGENFPPESGYTKDGKGGLKIGKKVVQQADYRTPNGIKEAICSAFKKAPKECKKTLEKLDKSAPASGGC
ncbi:hypothetical protein DRH14_00195 [Candidatus Shapirobacteria bacterium]|nr:MAG: hypothetical protein DRH14_00195 [Candidatus Shapirobacteria bacterium]